MKPLKLKETVKINGRHLDAEIIAIFNAVRRNAPELKDGFVWCTSACDSKHMVGSKHYSNEGLDFRTNNVVGGADAIKLWAKNIQIELGPQYDVVVEKDHLHVELDEK